MKKTFLFFLIFLSINNSYALGIFFDKETTESLPEEAASSSYTTLMNAPIQTHNSAEAVPSESFTSAPAPFDPNLKKLNYTEAVNYSRGLPNKVGNTRTMTYCAKGVRWLVNTLFGKDKNAPYATDVTSACSLSENTLNSGGLGASSKTGFRYKEVSYDLKSEPYPDGSIMICSTMQNPGCKKRNELSRYIKNMDLHGHAEMYIGGRWVSGANESATPACGARASNAFDKFTNKKVFILERTI